MTRCLLPVALALAVSFPLAAQNAAVAHGPDAPTANAFTPEQMNRQWLDATHKFEPERQKMVVDADEAIAAGPFRDDWQSLDTMKIPTWYADAKFGIFIHWGVFSVPAFGNEWYSRNMYVEGSNEFKHHQQVYGSQAAFGYKDFIPQFKMAQWDPAAWAALFRDAGARYVVPVAEHHDGFALYNSQLSDWTAVRMGPHRDLIGGLEKAVRADGLHFGVSFHRAEHDRFMGVGRTFPSDVNDPRYAGFYGPAEQHLLEGTTDDSDLSHDYTYLSEEYRRDWLARTTEIVETYHPDLVYFDWWVGYSGFREAQRRFAAFYYDQAAKRDQPVVLFSKLNNMSEGAGVHDVERGAMAGIQKQPWQTDTSISNASWGYIEHDTYKSPQVLLDELIDVVSKNGNLLLNIGPRSDGTIPDAAKQTLLAMGAWLKINGEAIYGSHPWTQFSEGPTQMKAGGFNDGDVVNYTPADFRFTTRDGHLYAIELRPPASGNDALIRVLGTNSGKTVKSVALLGDAQPVSWQQTAQGLRITLPVALPTQYALTYRIDLQ